MSVTLSGPVTEVRQADQVGQGPVDSHDSPLALEHLQVGEISVRESLNRGTKLLREDALELGRQLVLQGVRTWLGCEVGCEVASPPLLGASCRSKTAAASKNIST